MHGDGRDMRHSIDLSRRDLDAEGEARLCPWDEPGRALRPEHQAGSLPMSCRDTR